MSRPFNSTCCSRTASCRHRPSISFFGRFMMAVLVLVATTASPALAQSTYQPPQVRLLDDPFGRDAPPPGVKVPDLRPDPIPAYGEFPQRWQMMQRPGTCQPLPDPLTGRTTAWRCRMADGTTEVVR